MSTPVDAAREAYQEADRARCERLRAGDQKARERKREQEEQAAREREKWERQARSEIVKRFGKDAAAAVELGAHYTVVVVRPASGPPVAAAFPDVPRRHAVAKGKAEAGGVRAGAVIPQLPRDAAIVRCRRAGFMVRDATYPERGKGVEIADLSRDAETLMVDPSDTALRELAARK